MNKKLLITLALLMALCVPAYAVTSIDFNVNAPATGSIAYAGGGAPLIGLNIPVESVKPIGGTSTFFGSDIVLLNFSTGNLVAAGINEWIFGTGGSISIQDTTSGKTFLTNGSFTSVEVERVGTADFKVVLAGFTDSKTQDLFTLLGLTGLPTDGWEGNMNLSFFGTGTLGRAIHSSQILSGDVINTPPATVPVPPSVLLLGSGLLGLVGLRRFRKS